MTFNWLPFRVEGDTRGLCFAFAWTFVRLVFESLNKVAWQMQRLHFIQRCFRIACACSLLVLSGVESVTNAEELGTSVNSALVTVAPSIVRVRTIGNAGAEELEVASQVTTGVVISDRGEILTSLFGFSGQPAAIFVDDLDGQRVAAKVVARDYLRKLVLLQCGDGRFSPATMSGSRWPSVGAYSIAAGRMYPGKLPSASVGIVSAVNRIHGLAIQTDAKVSPVNYGGPLLDLSGQVRGILVPLSPRDSSSEIVAGVEWYDSGIGFAIPAVDALASAEKLRAGKDLFPGVVGVQLSTRNPLEEKFQVSSVYDGSPASVAGLKAGDVILEANSVKIDRFGLFESVIKSKYAGDSLNVRIKRDTEELNAEILLVDKLKPIATGFIGLIIQEAVTAGDSAIGVRIAVVPGSPLAAAGIPESVIVTEWNDQPVSSVADFSKLLQAVAVDREVNMKYKLSANDDQAVSGSVVPGARSSTLAVLSDSFAKNVLGTEGNELTDWKRQQEDLADDAGKVWYFAPSASKDYSCGLAVLASESNTPADILIRKWDQICRIHNLILVVVQNSENTELSREDSDLIPLAMAAVAKGREIDRDRVFLVAGKQQEDLAVTLLLDPRMKQIRAAAFVETWPRTAGASSEIVAAKVPSVLLLADRIQSRQGQALLNQAVTQLAELGALVTQHTLGGDVTLEESIASWAMGLKAR